MYFKTERGFIPLSVLKAGEDKMYIQIENLRGMTAEIAEFCKVHNIHSIDEFAETSDPDLIRNGDRGGVDQVQLLKLANQCREILHMNEAILDRLVDGHLVFVESTDEVDPSDPKWPFRVVEEAQAPYGLDVKIVRNNPVKV